MSGTENCGPSVSELPGGLVDSAFDRETEVEGAGLTPQEVQELIDVSVAAIYERAYNEALDDVIGVLKEGLELDELTYRLGELRKKCFTSSLQRQ